MLIIPLDPSIIMFMHQRSLWKIRFLPQYRNFYWRVVFEWRERAQLTTVEVTGEPRVPFVLCSTQLPVKAERETVMAHVSVHCTQATASHLGTANTRSSDFDRYLRHASALPWEIVTYVKSELTCAMTIDQSGSMATRVERE